MIAIINTGEQGEDGKHHYRLQINDELITEFTHDRIDGLAVCLQRASEAAHRAHTARIEALLHLAQAVERAVGHD